MQKANLETTVAPVTGVELPFLTVIPLFLWFFKAFQKNNKLYQEKNPHFQSSRFFLSKRRNHKTKKTTSPNKPKPLPKIPYPHHPPQPESTWLGGIRRPYRSWRRPNCDESIVPWCCPKKRSPNQKSDEAFFFLTVELWVFVFGVLGVGGFGGVNIWKCFFQCKQ